jgi:hypothetical protein
MVGIGFPNWHHIEYIATLMAAQLFWFPSPLLKWRNLESEMFLLSHFAEHHMLGSLATEREAEKWQNQTDRPQATSHHPPKA